MQDEARHAEERQAAQLRDVRRTAEVEKQGMVDRPRTHDTNC